MKSVLSLLISSLLAFTSVNLQKNNSESPLQSVVETELAFSRASRENGTRDAFLAFIASDGILFRPTAVNGKKWLLENAPPANAKRSLLSWYPIFADVSQGGDLGYTTGPWEFRQAIDDVKPVGYGNFITVWKKQNDDSWKFVVDLGTTNPQPTEPAPSWKPPEGNKSYGNKKRIDVSVVRVQLTKRDWEFSDQSQAKGFSKAFLAYATNDVRLYRNDNFPFVGREAVKKALAREKSIWSSQPDFGDIARSGDLGYTYGSYEIKTDPSSAPIEKGNYLRIWKHEDGVWKIVLQVTNPLPRT